ncbi:secreted RxLR effector protein 161 [Cryptomeria japonica]|uniref:secreted RxLR effector protein 161 n=1 Tax=Cryptomeria japonica TaxID=3369 RepID=UPI0025ABA45F|nr:secreted RxLR effector protein 161 [Cryptomeria japonica]
MYLVNTRPDICYAVNALSQFMSMPKHVHLVAAKHILRYLRDTVGYGLKYPLNTPITLEGYSDADWAGSVKDRKNTFGICFSLGSAVISWACRKQSSIALSTPEVEYIAASIASREAVWLRKLLSELFGQPWESTVIHCDNQSCIKMYVNPVFHDRSKHVKTHYHFIRDMVQRGDIQLKYVSIDDQMADILTKALSRVKFMYFRDKLGVVENETLVEKESQPQ